MAVRRMLHSEVVGSDDFLELPFSAQMLYVQITMAADDDGFCNGARRLQRLIGAQQGDLELLVKKRFLLQFGKVVVVKHWRMANCLKNDRLKPLTYPEIAEKIYLKPNRIYTDHPVEGAENLKTIRDRLWNPSGFPVEEKGKEENRREKKRTEENRKEKKLKESTAVAVEEENPAATAAADSLQRMDGLLGQGVLMLTQAQTQSLLDLMGLDCFDYYTEKLSSFIRSKNARVKNHYQTLLRWWQEDQAVKEDAHEK